MALCGNGLEQIYKPTNNSEDKSKKCVILRDSLDAYNSTVIQSKEIQVYIDAQLEILSNVFDELSPELF